MSFCRLATPFGPRLELRARDSFPAALFSFPGRLSVLSWGLGERVCHPADSEAYGGRRGFPGTGSGESTGFPDDIGISETSFESAGRTVPAGTTAGFRGWSAEAGTSGFGR